MDNLSLEIDDKAFRNLMKEKDYTVASLSRELCMTSGGVSNAITRKKFTKRTVKMLELMGFKYEDYKAADGKEERKEEKESSGCSLTEKDMEAIRKIVREELERIWN